MQHLLYMQKMWKNPHISVDIGQNVTLFGAAVLLYYKLIGKKSLARLVKGIEQSFWHVVEWYELLTSINIHTGDISSVHVSFSRKYPF